MAGRKRAAGRGGHAQSRPAPARGLYVYCVIMATEARAFGAHGIGAVPPERAEVFTVHHEDIAAVVSEVPLAVYEATRANVDAHRRVTELAMRTQTVLPITFGTVLETRADVETLLRSAYRAYKDLLTKMQENIELGLEVTWDRERVVHEVEAESDEIRRLKGEICAQRGSTYFARLRYGRMVDAALRACSERYIEEILASLRPVSIATRAKRPAGDTTIMDAAFLVGRDQQAEFAGVVKQIGARHETLTFRSTGPWPPNTFVVRVGDRGC